MIEKVELMNDLLDQYELLLTPNQRSVAIDYYQHDLSLQEIADNQGVSKAAIHESLKRAEGLLLDYESKLNCVSKQHRLNELLNSLEKCENEEVNQLLKTYQEENHE